MAEENIYTAARAEWNDRYYDEAKRRRNQTIRECLLLILALVAVAGQVYVLQRNPVYIAVAQIDESGRFLGAYEVTESAVTVPKTTIIGSDLARTIEELRNVGADYMQKRAEYQRANSRMAGQAARFVDDHFKTFLPHEIMKTATITVSVKSVIAEGEKTWRVRWVEEKHDRQSNAVLSKSWWEAVMVVEFQAPKKEEALLNPFGVRIVTLSWGEMQGVEQ